MPNNKVSVLIPAYNHAAYISECLDSVINQSYPNWEAIIVDDGSKDNTSEVVKPYLSDKIKYIYQENAGTSAARNKAIQNAGGELLLPLDADDILSEGAIQNLVSAFEQDPDILIAYSDTEKFGNDTSKISAREPIEFKDILLRNYIFNTSMFQKKDIGDEIRYDENIKGGQEDWEFWLHLISKFPERKIHKMKEPVFYYRSLADSRSKSIKKDKEQAELNHHYIYQKHHESYHQHYPSYLYNLRRRIMYEKKYEQIYNKPIYKLYDKIMKLWK